MDWRPPVFALLLMAMALTRAAHADVAPTADCPDITEGEVRVVALEVLYAHAERRGDSFLAVTDLTDRLTQLMRPCGYEMVRMASGRTRFETTIRNLDRGRTNRTSLEFDAAAEYRRAADGDGPAAWRIRRNGRRDVEYLRRWVGVCAESANAC